MSARSNRRDPESTGGESPCFFSAGTAPIGFAVHILIADAVHEFFQSRPCGGQADENRSAVHLQSDTVAFVQLGGFQERFRNADSDAGAPFRELRLRAHIYLNISQPFMVPQSATMLRVRFQVADRSVSFSGVRYYI